MPGSFAHLHVHTEYSMLDGAARIDELFAEAARMQMPAMAMTDHGQLFGAVDFYLAGRKHGVKPILGCLLAGQEIITADGVKNVEDVRIGDMVLTHQGRFRRVLRTMRRQYQGKAYTVSLGGRYGRSRLISPPVLQAPTAASIVGSRGRVCRGCVRNGLRSLSSITFQQTSLRP